ncbi:bS21 family ribosomal protein [Aeoliella mucimassa]|nr:bS21 family ribosomal protein [Aeoliella mucimassa]
MPGRIVVREGELLPDALRRFRRVVHRSTRRQWSKTRPGHYMKPSELARNKRALSRRNAWLAAHGYDGYNTVYLTMQHLMAREPPFKRGRRKKPHAG